MAKKAKPATPAAAPVASTVDSPEATAPVDESPVEFDAKAKLVEMTKEGVRLKVHPTCVKAHIDQGWMHV